jgi:hypothetical protein
MKVDKPLYIDILSGQEERFMKAQGPLTDPEVEVKLNKVNFQIGRAHV